MAALNFLAPTHLAIFVTDPSTGLPLSRLPLYVEVALPKIIPPPPVHRRLHEPMRAALFDIDANTAPNVRDKIEISALTLVGELIDETNLNQLSAQRAVEFFRQVFKELLIASNRTSLNDIPEQDVMPMLRALIARIASAMDLVLRRPNDTNEVIWAEPLGVLSTDHVGYVSFDLRRLRPQVQSMLLEAIEARRNQSASIPNVAIWVQAFGQEQKFDALAQARFSQDAIVAKLAITGQLLPASIRNMGPRSLQNPSLTDWRLSPASFAASPKTLVGENGCEELVPANLALQEFVLRQVVRVTDSQNPDIPSPYKFAYVDDYKVSWYSLGHSLGEILYSLPLAPAESVKLAVIDWAWDSLTKRDENTRLTEELLHQTHRDRSITETVKAALKEMQHGSSFMGGAAGSSGATGGADLGVVGLGAAVGNTWSLGGSTATSNGSRDLAAENVQRLSDSFSQASSTQRELNSTVVIQARQEEKESIQTRTFTNYNHSHTLTILYYEVLRHFRVTVEWVRRRPAILAKVPEAIVKFEAVTLMAHRFLLESALIDPSLKTAFDALEKQEIIREHQLLNNITPSDNWTAPWWEGNIEFPLFEFGFKTGDGIGETDELVMINAIIRTDDNKIERPLLSVWNKGSETQDANVGDRFNYDDPMYWFIAKPGTPIKWHQLIGFEFVLHDSDEWRIDRLAINAFHAGGALALIDNIEAHYYFPVNSSSNTVTYIRRPAPAPALQPPAARSPEKSITPEERHQINKLMVHFEYNKEYYNRVIMLASDPNAIALKFEQASWSSGQTLADNADPTPLEIFGSYVAYPLAKGAVQIDDILVLDIAAALNNNDPARRQWAQEQLAAMSEINRNEVLARVALASAKSERLITLPTRGVFAEGKLGHCNLSEEIDDTRFWKWEEHPIPIQAPDINPITPIQPQPQVVNATPTAFPQSLVNIVNPTSAPDPSGLSAALALLGTPNIFRDMSGRAEVADLLKKLSDNTIAIADAANRARDIQSKYGTELNKGSTDTSAPAFNNPSPSKPVEPEPKPISTSEANQQIKTSENQKNKGTITTEDHKDNVKKSLGNMLGGNKGSAVTVTINFKHSISGPLDGEFGIEFIGPIGAAFFTRTSGGVGAGVVNIETGAEYTIQIKGKRTRLPLSMNTVVQIPSVVGNSAFNVDVSHHLTKREVPIEANIVATITKARKTINITVIAEEVAKDIKISAKVMGSGSLKAELEGQLGLEFAAVDVGHVKVGGAVEVTLGGEAAVEFPVEYKRLTGNVTAPKNELVL